MALKQVARDSSVCGKNIASSPAIFSTLWSRYAFLLLIIKLFQSSGSRIIKRNWQLQFIYIRISCKIIKDYKSNPDKMWYTYQMRLDLWLYTSSYSFSPILIKFFVKVNYIVERTLDFYAEGKTISRTFPAKEKKNTE